MGFQDSQTDNFHKSKPQFPLFKLKPGLILYITLFLLPFFHLCHDTSPTIVLLQPKHKIMLDKSLQPQRLSGMTHHLIKFSNNLKTDIVHSSIIFPNRLKISRVT